MEENEELDDNGQTEKITNIDLEDGQRALKGMYEDWFLDYASYVILERAVPHINDGLKPVQRRFLHAMKEMDDAPSSLKKDTLEPSELLPSKVGEWANAYPAMDALKGKNFLQSGHHVGVNTVGQTLRNANMQLRSEPPNPQVKVSPWQQSTIEPDVNRKPLEIGGCA